MSNKLKIGILSLVGLVIGVAFGMTASEPNKSVAGVNFEQEIFKEGFISEKSAVVGPFTQGGSVLRFTATSTQAARTLTAAELNDNSIILINATNSPALTLTLPATSTLTSVIPTAGQSRTWQIYNAHTTAGTTTTVVAGAGIDLQGDTANDDIINGGGILGTLNCFRLPSTDIVCNISEKVVAD